MIGRCETCKHWQEPEREYGRIQNTRDCKAVIQAWDASELNADDDYRTIKPEYAGRLAFAEDGEAYRAALVTLPDFGCVQYDPADEKKLKPSVATTVIGTTETIFSLTAEIQFPANDLLDAFRKLAEHFTCLADEAEDVRECESQLLTSGSIKLKPADG